MTIRQQILDYLNTHETASAREIAHLLGCSAANARYHLSGLLADGVITPAASPPVAHPGRPLRPGRPVQRYTLTRQADRHNLGPLATAALGLLLLRTPPEQQRFLLRELAEELAGQLLTTRSLTLRLSFAIQRLNEMGYRARWEAHAAGPRIILGHCPYALILPQQPLLCALDAALLSTLLEARLSQIARLEPAPSGLPYCMFQVE